MLATFSNIENTQSLHTKASVTAFLMDKGSQSIVSAGCGQLVKMLIILEPHGIFRHCPATGMQNGDEALPSIILADRGLLVKMPITLEPHHIF